MFRFAQENEFFIKIGKFELDPAQFPKDRFDLRLKAGNVSLDDEGNLFIGDDPLKGNVHVKLYGESSRVILSFKTTFFAEKSTINTEIHIFRSIKKHLTNIF